MKYKLYFIMLLCLFLIFPSYCAGDTSNEGLSLKGYTIKWKSINPNNGNVQYATATSNSEIYGKYSGDFVMASSNDSVDIYFYDTTQNKWLFSHTSKPFSLCGYRSSTFIYYASKGIKSEENPDDWIIQPIPLPEEITFDFSSPRNGFTDSGNTMSFTILYNGKLAFNNYEINLKSTTIDKTKLQKAFKFTSNSNSSGNKSLYSFSLIGLDSNPGHNLTAELTLNDKVIKSTTILFGLVSGVVDENGDGKDDRTGLPVDWGSATPNPNIPTDGSGVIPNKSSYPEGIIGSVAWGFDSLIAILSIPFVYFGKFVSLVSENAKTLINSFGDFNKFIGQIFNWMPAQLSTLVFSIVGILGGITIWKSVKS